MLLRRVACGVSLPAQADGGNAPAYVNNNPSAFADAYFDIQWLKIYQ